LRLSGNTPPAPLQPGFDAAEWHRTRRKQILAAHPEVRGLIGSDAWVFSLGLVVLPAYGWSLYTAPSMSWADAAVQVWTIGSLRSTWAVACSHAISHGRWRELVGPFGSARYNAALAVVNVGTVFGVLPSYWLLHASHHIKLGAYTLTEARERARRDRPLPQPMSHPSHITPRYYIH
jgi:hypothetical protein